jgi:ribosomal protein S27AE
MEKIMTLSCPSCGAKVRLSDDAGRLHCDHCGNDHILQMNFIPVAPAQKPALRPRIPVPQEMQIQQDGTASRIVQRWFSWKYVPMAFFAVVWDGFLFFWYSMALGNGAPLMFILFPLGHLAVGAWITYTTLAGFVNRTTIELNQGELSIWFEPLPWPGEKTLKAGEIKQLFCKEHTRRTKNGTATSYHLYAVTRDDHQLKLLTNLDSPDAAQFLEQQLESWMRIQDQPVVGELG